jgi:predicted Fe-Mo cluster-binding NifX family protein
VEEAVDRTIKEAEVDETKSIAVAAEDETGLDGQVAGHFGRCQAYVVVKASGGQIEGSRVVPNPHAQAHQPGQMPRFIQGLGVDAILAGGMGPRAINMFAQAGIDVATGLTGTVRDVVESYLRGELSGTVPCRHDHPNSCGGGHHE